MSTTHKILESETDFMVAALSQTHQYNDYPEGRIQDYGGTVVGYHSGMVKIAGDCF